jgi:DNA-directed RNA polymerase beta subunit
MPIKTKDYLAKVRNKTGFTDYKIAKEYDIHPKCLQTAKHGFLIVLIFLIYIYLNLTESAMPESFNVLVKEIRSLGIDVELEQH